MITKGQLIILTLGIVESLAIIVFVDSLGSGQLNVFMTTVIRLVVGILMIWVIVKVIMDWWRMKGVV